MRRIVDVTLAMMMALGSRGLESGDARQPQVEHPQRTAVGKRLSGHKHPRRVKRSGRVRREFMRRTGYPQGRPGYVVDHIQPLACGGADALWNMQWQTLAEARAKDKIERRGCRGSKGRAEKSPVEVRD